MYQLQPQSKIRIEVSNDVQRDILNSIKAVLIENNGKPIVTSVFKDEGKVVFEAEFLKEGDAISASYFIRARMPYATCERIKIDESFANPQSQLEKVAANFLGYQAKDSKTFLGEKDKEVTGHEEEERVMKDRKEGEGDKPLPADEEPIEEGVIDFNPDSEDYSENCGLNEGIGDWFQKHKRRFFDAEYRENEFDENRFKFEFVISHITGDDMLKIEEEYAFFLAKHAYENGKTFSGRSVYDKKTCEVTLLFDNEESARLAITRLHKIYPYAKFGNIVDIQLKRKAIQDEYEKNHPNSKSSSNSSKRKSDDEYKNPSNEYGTSMTGLPGTSFGGGFFGGGGMTGGGGAGGSW